MTKQQYKPSVLREWRSHFGQSQEQVARSIGVVAQTVYRAESGTASYSLLQKLASLYGQPMQDVLRLENK